MKRTGLCRRPQFLTGRRRRVYAFFLKPGFKPTQKAIAEIVLATSIDHATVIKLWAQFKRGVGVLENEETSELEELTRAYEADIARLEEANRRRERLDLGEDDDEDNENDDDPPPSSRP